MSSRPLSTREVLPAPTMTLKQIAYAVRHGRKLTLHVFDNDPVTGYMAAMDDVHYLVLVPHPVDPTFSRRLVAKGSISLIDLHDENTYREEKCWSEMENIIARFRDYLSVNVLGRQDSQSPRKVGSP